MIFPDQQTTNHPALGYIFLLISLMFFGNTSAAPVKQCSVISGDKTAVLLELFTSEGCSSCPPADLALSRLGYHKDILGKVVPLSLHVDYWNYLGWRDPFSNKQYTKRQYYYAKVYRDGLVYTPQFVLSGKKIAPNTSDDEIRNAILALNKNKAPIKIRINLQTQKDKNLYTEVTAKQVDKPIPKDVMLFVVVYESKLRNQVTRGENNGKILHHDFVVRKLYGPVFLDESGKTIFKKTINLHSSWNKKHIGIAAFVQRQSSAQVLQALAKPICQ